MNHHIDPKPGSEWLSTCRQSAYKFGLQINDKLNAKLKCGRMYPATNNKDAVVMFCVAKPDQPAIPRFVTDCHVRNLAVYKKQMPLPNNDEQIELVATNPV